MQRYEKKSNYSPIWKKIFLKGRILRYSSYFIVILLKKHKNGGLKAIFPAWWGLDFESICTFALLKARHKYVISLLQQRKNSDLSRKVLQSIKDSNPIYQGKNYNGTSNQQGIISYICPICIRYMYSICSVEKRTYTGQIADR